MPSFLTHLECSLTGERHAAGERQRLSRAGRPLLARYDLPAIRRRLTRQALAGRSPDLWRYRELLPLKEPDRAVSLGESMTPLVAAPGLAALIGLRRLEIKDESRLPTGSFKARGLAVAVSMARELGVTEVAIPTAGNAGAALAAYAARTGLHARVFCPADSLESTIREAAICGAEVHLVDGFIDECGRLVERGVREHGWYDMSTLKEPYRLEGKKTMGFELAEQLGWRLPDVIFYPTGGGTGLIGMWKAFAELEAIGWIDAHRPRLVAVQAEGCAPIVRALQRGEEFAEPWLDPRTIALGIRVPAAVGDFLMLRALRESQGFAITVSDAAMLSAQRECAEREGLLLGLEGAATLAACRQALADGRIARDEHVVLFNCGSALKYPLPLAPVTSTADRRQAHGQ